MKSFPRWTVTLLAFGIFLSGCASVPPLTGLRIEGTGSAGKIVNDSGKTLHNVKVWVEMWTAGNIAHTWGSQLGDMEPGDAIDMQYRFSNIDRIKLRGRSDEGRFSVDWP